MSQFSLKGTKGIFLTLLKNVYIPKDLTLITTAA